GRVRADGRVPADREVIELVAAGADALPDPETEVPGDRVARRVHDLGPVRVPLREPVVDHDALVGQAGTEDGERHVPEPDDRIVGSRVRDEPRGSRVEPRPRRYAGLHREDRKSTLLNPTHNGCSY